MVVTSYTYVNIDVLRHTFVNHFKMVTDNYRPSYPQIPHFQGLIDRVVTEAQSPYIYQALCVVLLNEFQV